MVSQPHQRPIPPASNSLKGKEKDVSKTNFNIYIAPLKPKTQRCFEDRELNQARSKPDTVNRPIRTARIFVHHYNSTQYCNTETLFIFPFLQTNITSQMWPTRGRGVIDTKVFTPTHVHTHQFNGYLSGEPGSTTCPLNFPSPFSSRQCILQVKTKFPHILLDTT